MTATSETRSVYVSSNVVLLNILYDMYF